MTKKLLAHTDEQAKRAICSYHEANLLSLEIYNCLREEFNRLSEDYGPVANIVGLFFHDLMVHFSGVAIQREFIEHVEEGIQFPFVSGAYARRPFRIEEHSYYDYTKELAFPPSLWRTKGMFPIAAGDAVPFDAHEQRFTRKSFTFLTRYQMFSKAYLPDRKRQLDALAGLIEKITIRLAIPELKTIIENWHWYAEYHTSIDQPEIRERGLIVGTRASLQNRKLATNFLQQNKPVIGMTHGEVTNTIFDEPLFGYAELGLCSLLVDYGDLRLKGKLSQPLTSPQKVLSRTSPVIKRIRESGRARSAQVRRPRSYLYVPTVYNGTLHYGPYRGFEDGLYVKWQSELLSIVPNVVMKAHPKSPRPFFSNPVESRLLEKCFLEYDVLILDYYSTAATIVISSNKPVVFFDIGLRNLMPEYLVALRERCFYVDIDWVSDLRGQIGDALRRFEAISGDRKNNFPEYFSISDAARDMRAGVPTLFNEALKTL